jgi:lipid II:glycine glycyltransferase (peptidoglycan interpeptide bridge formation enzyme)
MSSHKIRPLAAGYHAEFDSIDEPTWCQLVTGFDDGNIYQTWPYGAVVGGRRNMGHLVLKRNGEAVAVAQARIKKLPVVGLGIAYIHWGPLWRRTGSQGDAEVFRQAVRALRNEFVCRQHLTLRLFPIVFANDAVDFNSILAEEGLASVGEESRGRTILMDLAPPLGDVREGLSAHWKRELKVADKQNLEFLEGTGPDLFDRFIAMYKEMVSRKKFLEPNDIYQFKQIQHQLPEPLKMRVLLCESAGVPSAGAIYSLVGNSAIYLFGATSNAGMKSRGSYFLQWKIVEALKRDGASIYNLNGINPEKNAGTYKFKNDLAGKNGRDVFYSGRFDGHSSSFNQFCIEMGDKLRKSRRQLLQRVRSSGSQEKPSATAAVKSMGNRGVGGKSQTSQVVRDSENSTAHKVLSSGPQH